MLFIYIHVSHYPHLWGALLNTDTIYQHCNFVFAAIWHITYFSIQMTHLSNLTEMWDLKSDLQTFCLHGDCFNIFTSMLPCVWNAGMLSSNHKQGWRLKTNMSINYHSFLSLLSEMAGYCERSKDIMWVKTQKHYILQRVLFDRPHCLAGDGILSRFCFWCCWGNVYDTYHDSAASLFCKGLLPNK